MQTVKTCNNERMLSNKEGEGSEAPKRNGRARKRQVPAAVKMMAVVVTVRHRVTPANDKRFEVSLHTVSEMIQQRSEDGKGCVRE